MYYYYRYTVIVLNIW